MNETKVPSYSEFLNEGKDTKMGLVFKQVVENITGLTATLHSRGNSIQVVMDNKSERAKFVIEYNPDTPENSVQITTGGRIGNEEADEVVAELQDKFPKIDFGPEYK